MSVNENIRLSFCWSHVRRDFQGVGKGYRKFLEWADGWERLINDLFMLNKERLAVRDNPREFDRRNRALKSTLATIEDIRESELSDPSYKAANWTFVGETQGRGKLDTRNLHPLPIKHILFFPLHKRFRYKLRS